MQESKLIINTAIIVSKCTKDSKSNELEKGYSEFAFKGSYLGHKVSRILIEPSEGQEFIKGEEYVIVIRTSALTNGVLRASVIKSKII